MGMQVDGWMDEWIADWWTVTWWNIDWFISFLLPLSVWAVFLTTFTGTYVSLVLLFCVLGLGEQWFFASDANGRSHDDLGRRHQGLGRRRIFLLFLLLRERLRLRCGQQPMDWTDRLARGQANRWVFLWVNGLCWGQANRWVFLWVNGLCWGQASRWVFLWVNGLCWGQANRWVFHSSGLGQQLDLLMGQWPLLGQGQQVVVLVGG